MLGAPVPDPHEVIRVAENREKFTGFRHEGQTFVLTVDALALSSVERGQTPARISVWDAVLTEVKLACAYSRKPLGEAFLAVASALRAVVPVDVFYDSHIEATLVGEPGADGHAAITGLDQGSDTDRRVRRRRLVQVFRHWEGVPPVPTTENQGREAA